MKKKEYHSPRAAWVRREKGEKERMAHCIGSPTGDLFLSFIFPSGRLAERVDHTALLTSLF